MELKLVNKDGRNLTVKIIGEDHTLCNILRKTLHEDEHVITASYTIEHPLLEHPTFYVNVKKGKTPERALTDAAERIIESCDGLQKKLLRELKK